MLPISFHTPARGSKAGQAQAQTQTQVNANQTRRRCVQLTRNAKARRRGRCTRYMRTHAKRNETSVSGVIKPEPIDYNICNMQHAMHNTPCVSASRQECECECGDATERSRKEQKGTERNRKQSKAQKRKSTRWQNGKSIRGGDRTPDLERVKLTS